MGTCSDKRFGFLLNTGDGYKSLNYYKSKSPFYMNDKI